MLAASPVTCGNCISHEATDFYCHFHIFAINNEVPPPSEISLNDGRSSLPAFRLHLKADKTNCQILFKLISFLYFSSSCCARLSSRAFSLHGKTEPAQLPRAISVPMPILKQIARTKTDTYSYTYLVSMGGKKKVKISFRQLSGFIICISFFFRRRSRTRKPPRLQAYPGKIDSYCGIYLSSDEPGQSVFEKRPLYQRAAETSTRFSHSKSNFVTFLFKYLNLDANMFAIDWYPKKLIMIPCNP